MTFKNCSIQTAHGAWQFDAVYYPSKNLLVVSRISGDRKSESHLQEALQSLCRQFELPAGTRIRYPAP